MSRTIRDSVSIVLAGEAGQGIQSIEAVLTALLKQGSYHVFAAKEYMSRVRGGVNSVEIVVSSRAAPAYVDRIDLLIPLTPDAIPHLKKRISAETIIIGDAALIGTAGMIDVPFQKLATEAGSAIMANTLAAGLIAALLGIDATEGGDFMEHYFARKSEDIRSKNRAVFLKGHLSGTELRSEIKIEIKRDPAVSESIMLTANEAVAMGAVAGGVQYVCAYPMSPGTTVIELLAEYSKTFDILVEQVEDEVGVVNMAMGAWFAGARTLVTTSGGGFALMTEGVSMSGIADIPLVVHIAQRPGPATGLPTRTLQGDLFLAAFAGHGDFARLVLTPGSLQESFALSAAAFEFADRFQIPVFLLTDQYMLDAYYDTAAFDASAVDAWIDGLGDKAHRVSQAMEGAVAASEGRSGGGAAIATKYNGALSPAGFPMQRDARSHSWISKSTAEYQRSALTADGISPRAIPGYGSGVTTVDSDEHDETGHITEDLDLRVDMVHKRSAKEDLLRQTIPLPEWIGDSSAKVAIVGWGSTKHLITEAILALGPDLAAKVGGIAQIHFTWVNPLPIGLADYLGTAEQLILVENNESGHLGKLLRMDQGIHMPDPVLKYDGLPFSVEGLTAELKKRLKG